MSPLPDIGRGRVAAALAALPALLAAGCGASRPDPVEVDPPRIDRDTVRAGEGLDAAGELRPVRAPAPPKPWLPMGVRWSPAEPREGEAVGLRVFQPEGGRVPVDVEGELGGRPVHFARTGRHWFGVAAAPIGSAGPTELVLRLRLGPDSTAVQRVGLEIGDRTFPATRLSVAPRYSDPGPEALARIRREKRRIRATLAQVTERWLPRGPFARPRDTRITSPFGQRRLFNQELQSRHTGVDLAGRRGDPVRASARGRVALTGEFFFAGRAVFLDHGLGVYTAYFHLSEIAAAPGDTLARGDVLGRVGATGRVTGPHLHWGLYVGGHSLDAGSLLRMTVPGADSARPPASAVLPAPRRAGQLGWP